MAKSTELTVQETRELLLNPAYQAQKTFEMQQRMANMYVQSTIVPQAYRGNIGNCVIAIDMAQRMQANPLMVMQNLYIVNGNPAWSSKFLVSCINMSGRFTPLRYQFTGKKGTPQYGCRAYAYEKNDVAHKEPLCSVWITMEMAEKEGWTKKAGSKWLTMPDQMLIYRAAAFWSRAYAPEISMGFLTKEEVEDAVYEEIIDTPIVSTYGEPEPAKEDIMDVAVEDAEEKKTESDIKEKPDTSSVAQAAREIIERHKKQKLAEEEGSAADAVAAAMQKQTRNSEETFVDTNTGELFNG